MSNISTRAAMLVGFSICAVLPARAQPVTINMMAYPGLFQDRYQEAVIRPFMKANPDIKVNYIAGGFSAQMLGQLRAQKAAPQIDVVIMDLAVSKSGTDEGLFSILDENNAPIIKELYPAARSAKLAGVGVTFDNLVLIYNAELVKSEPTSWTILGDKTYAGKVVMQAAPNSPGISLTMILEKMAGGIALEKNLDRGVAEMVKIAPNVLTWDPKPDPYAVVANGQVALAIGYNARSQIYADESQGRLKVVLPNEGTVFQINTINLVEGAPHKDAALKFITYALSAQAQKAFTESMFYAPTNRTADIAPSAIARTVVKSMDRVIPIDWIEYVKIRDKITEQWRRQIIPASRR